MRTSSIFVLVGGVLALVLATASHADTYRVGTGCTYPTIGAAVAYANAHDISDLVDIKVSGGTLASGTSGDSIYSSDIEFVNPRWDVVIEGGYSSCTSTTPTGFTTVRSLPVSQHIITISNYLVTKRTLTVRRIHFCDAEQEALAGWNFVSLNLGSGAELSNNGGGVRLGTGTDTAPANWPSLTLTDGARIHDNTPFGGVVAGAGTITLRHASIDHNQQVLASASSWGSGGGVSLWQSGSQLILDSSDGNNIISDNTADDKGGGIYLDHASLNLDVASGGYNDISGNTAGSQADNTTGYGGGIYSNEGNIEFHSGPSGAGYHNIMNGNTANYGGAIMVSGGHGGTGTSPTQVLLLNTRFSYNTAHYQGGALYSFEAVDWTVDHGSIPTCTVGFGSCSTFAYNTALGNDVPFNPDLPGGNGGVIYMRNLTNNDNSWGSAHFYHTLFVHNTDPNGTAAVAMARNTSKLVFERNVFDANSAYQLDPVTYVIDSRTLENVDFRYNTVLPTNSTFYVLRTMGGTLDVTGSIIETPVLFAASPIWDHPFGANVVHHGCLLSATVLQDMNGDRGWVQDARLDAGSYAPAGASAAIDHCNITPAIDFYQRSGAYDVNGVPARYGNYDLGAVEQTDILFYNGFGNRPDN